MSMSQELGYIPSLIFLSLICPNFVGTKFFRTFVGGINLYGELKCFFYEFPQEMRMHQELLFADILKFTKTVL